MHHGDEAAAGGRIVSVNIGQVRSIDVRGKRVQTSIYKFPVAGEHEITSQGIAGDRRVDPRRLGEENHAVYAYSRDHYPYWAERLARPIELGQFGENLTVDGLTESAIRIGDTLRCGAALLQVAQPRIPCRKLDVRIGSKFSRIFLESRRVGYYLRVLQPGSVRAGDPVRVLETDPESPTVDDFVRLTQFDYWDASGLRSLLRAHELMSGWREIIENKLARAETARGWFGLRPLSVLERSAGGASLLLGCARGRQLPGVEHGQLLPLALGDNAKNRILGHAYPLVKETESRYYRVTLPGKGAPGADLVRELREGDTVLAGAPRLASELGRRVLAVGCD